MHLKWSKIVFFLSSDKLTIRFVHFVVQFFVLEHSLEVPSCYLFNWSLFHSRNPLPVFSRYRSFFFSSRSLFSQFQFSMIKNVKFSVSSLLEWSFDQYGHIYIYALIRFGTKKRYDDVRCATDRGTGVCTDDDA